PDTIVATEVAACEIAATAKRKRLTEARLVNVITDYQAEPVWVQPEVDAYAVADKDVCDQLILWGAPADRILVCGIPTEACFLVPHDVQSTLARCNLNTAAPIVLIMGGGMGPTHMDEVVVWLLKSGQRMQIVAVAGHDKRAYRRLHHLQLLPWVTLCILRWTEDIPALMQLASVLITKPGGLTVSEAAASALPSVIFDSIPGPERRNAERVIETRAGVLTNSPREAAVAAISLLNDESTRQRMSASAKRLANPDAGANIARLALNENASKPELARTMIA